MAPMNEQCHVWGSINTDCRGTHHDGQTNMLSWYPCSQARYVELQQPKVTTVTTVVAMSSTLVHNQIGPQQVASETKTHLLPFKPFETIPNRFLLLHTQHIILPPTPMRNTCALSKLVSAMSSLGVPIVCQQHTGIALQCTALLDAHQPGGAGRPMA